MLGAIEEQATQVLLVEEVINPSAHFVHVFPFYPYPFGQVETQEFSKRNNPAVQDEQIGMLLAFNVHEAHPVT